MRASTTTEVVGAFSIPLFLPPSFNATTSLHAREEAFRRAFRFSIRREGEHFLPAAWFPLIHREFRGSFLRK